MTKRMPRVPLPRVLPLTIAAMLLLLLAKAATFASEATAALGLAPAASPGAVGQVVAETSPPGPPKAANIVLPKPPQVTHDVQAREAGLLEDLRRRRTALDARERALDERNAVLGAAELRLQEEINHLSSLQAKMSSLETSNKQRQNADWEGLVKVYEAMKPQDAATIFDVLDMHVLLEVLDRMKVRKTAAVLAAMQPERARLATQMLAEMRLQRDMAAPVISKSDQALNLSK